MQLYPNKRVSRSTMDNGIVSLKIHQYGLIDRLYFKLLFFPVISPVLGYFAAKRNVSEYLNDITDTEVAGIDTRDHPDYCDAFIESATWRSSLTPLTEAQIDQLNDRHSDFVYEAVQSHLY